MGDFHRLSQEELRAHLDEQLEFLRRSADSFDQGFDGEAKRLAASIRILLHDTKRSTSLLSQLGMKAIPFADTAGPPDEGNLLSSHNLISVEMGEGPARYVPQLDGNYLEMIDFDEWWQQPVFVDSQKRTLTRRDLILTAADKDGGAHVDPALTSTYADLSRRNSLGWTTNPNGEWNALRNPERAAIRQIAHEVLKTLVPGYSKKPDHKGTVFSRVYLSGSPPPGFENSGGLTRQQRRAQERAAAKRRGRG